jgi:glucose-1-phosphate cytidylyltransferase
MKVVIFCGGYGLRMGEATQRVPKPMIPIGGRPILWHIMKWYASWGHTEFILCLGYKAEVVKEFFLNYNEALANDFILSDGGRRVELAGSDIESWRIAFVDTGTQSTIGERLKAIDRFLGDDEEFLCTYGDAVTDLPLDPMIAEFRERDKTAMLLQVRPTVNMHKIETVDGVVREIEDITTADIFINGGLFVFKRSIIDLIEPGEELVEEPFRRLIAEGELLAYRYDGFWQPMDTLKDQQRLESLWESGTAPWRVRAQELGEPVD